LNSFVVKAAKGDLNQLILHPDRLRSERDNIAQKGHFVNVGWQDGLLIVRRSTDEKLEF
jgi:hypothetical protein